jgi:hypothetical protein
MPLRGSTAVLFEQHEKRDATEILDAALPETIEYVPHRECVREVLGPEAGFARRARTLWQNGTMSPSARASIARR